jgi:tRNA U38,U39,U40 pseudouridine synthase TruA
MSEQRPPQHTREPAEGSNQDVQAAGAQRAGETDKGAHAAQQSPHTEEQAEGSEEEVDTSGAEQARDDD